MLRILLAALAVAISLPVHAAHPNKVLRYAFENYRQLVASSNWWKYIDIDLSKQGGKVASR